MNRLLLCAGDRRRPGWKTLDVENADYLAKLPPLPKFDVLWDEVEWVHGITSFYPWEAVQILTELRPAIREGGKLVLEQPDFRKAIQDVRWLFGDPTFMNPFHMNKWAYTPESLVDLLSHVGFSHVRVLEAEHHIPWRDFRIEAIA